MKEFKDTDELRGARFERVDLRDARFRDADFRNVKVVDAMLLGADISGLIEGLKINDVEVAPLVEAELDRRDPERVLMREAQDPDRMRAAWQIVERRWAETMARAQALPQSALHERVDEEWSFTETLRHLIFATDAWVQRTILGVEQPFHPIALPQTGYRPGAPIGIDDDASPSFEEVVAVRADRMTIVSTVIDALTPQEFARVCAQNPAPGYPTKTEMPVGDCLGVVLDEEWSHNQYARRDLAVLEAKYRA